MIIVKKVLASALVLTMLSATGAMCFAKENLVSADQSEIVSKAESMEELEDVGFDNRGVIERKNLVVLRRTQMPAVLIEVGFIDNQADNERSPGNQLHQ